MEEENLVNNTFENSALDIENILVNDLEVSNLVTTDNHLVNNLITNFIMKVNNQQHFLR